MDYIKIEQSLPKIENTRIKTAFEQAIIYFGKTSAGNTIINIFRFLHKQGFCFCIIDVWLAYLDYSRKHQALDFVAISRIHSRALHALDTDELKRFNTECALKNLT